VSVDGGMGDNIRPALYGSKYDAFVDGKTGNELKEVVTIVGKYCESGDVLIKDINLPVIEPKDTIAITTTGAYGYSMANNYNRNPRPAVVFVEDGADKLVIKRETFKDLMHLDVVE
jgi:diaminopimelate decarboxylase